MAEENGEKVCLSDASFDTSSSNTGALRFEAEESSSFPRSKCDDLRQFRQILTDEESRRLLGEHKKHLKRLVAEGHKDLQSIGFCRMNQSSLRSIIAEKVGRSMMSLQKLEADITEATEDITDFSEHQFDGNLVFDFDEQQRALEISQNSQRGRRREEMSSHHEDDDNDSFALPSEYGTRGNAVPATNRRIPLSPDVTVPLRGATETWQAIKHEGTIATMCIDCGADLHVIEDAEYIACPDCWMVGPVQQNVGGIAFECDGSSDNYGIGLGVKAQEVVQWVEDASRQGADCRRDL